MIWLVRDPQMLAICLWVLVAFIMAIIPSTDNHWRRAYVLMAVGFPLMIWVTWTGGVWYGVLALAVGASFLRWPLYHLYLWVKRRLAR